LVIASDGVFEFLTNEDVMEIIVPFYDKMDAEGASEKLCKEALETWKFVLITFNIKNYIGE